MTHVLISYRFLDGFVRSELDDHEVAGRGERLVPEFLCEAAGQGGDVHRRLLCPAPAQDLHRVEHLLRLELGELKRKNFFRYFAIFPPTNNILNTQNIFSMLLIVMFTVSQ